MAEQLSDGQDKDEVTIDLSGIFRFLLARFWIIIICFVLGAIAGFAAATLTYIPEFEATAKFIVDVSSTGSTSSSSSSDLTYMKNVVANVVAVVDTNRYYTYVSEQVEKGKLYGGDYSIEANDIAGYVTYTTNTTTSTTTSDSSITVSVVTREAALSKIIADVIAETFNNYVTSNYATAENTDIALSCIDDPVLPEEPVESSRRLIYALLGAVGVTLVYCVVMGIIFVVDTRIRNEDMIEEEFGIPLLGTIPLIVEEKPKKGKKKKGGKAA